MSHILNVNHFGSASQSCVEIHVYIASQTYHVTQRNYAKPDLNCNPRSWCKAILAVKTILVLRAKDLLNPMRVMRATSKIKPNHALRTSFRCNPSINVSHRNAETRYNDASQANFETHPHNAKPLNIRVYN